MSPHGTPAFRAVLFDWRGTLVTTLTDEEWAAEALRRLGRPDSPRPLSTVLAGVAGLLDGPGVDSHAARHRETYVRVLRDAGLDDDLVATLYAVESDVSLNRFADDAPAVLGRLRAAGCRIAVVSDIHVDIRPAFAAAGLGRLVDVFTLSVEHGVQKPDPALFAAALDELGARADEALMVGDRAGPDGAAVAAGLVTLLLPPLRSTVERRLHRVLAVCGLVEDEQYRSGMASPG